jgi:hypothetical protein
MQPKFLNTSTNCIPTPAECVVWNSGNIESLGICNGDFLPKIIWEIVYKLQEIAGEDISQFDLDDLLTICNKKAPKEITLLSILTIMRDNQVCLKDYLLALEKAIADLTSDSTVKVSLKCYADFDSQGNSLGVTREQFDQLIIDNLCRHEDSITTLNGKVSSLQKQLDDFVSNPIVAEPEFTTCKAANAYTSVHVKAIAEDLCQIEEDLGEPSEAALVLGATPENWSTSAFDDSLTKYSLGDAGFIDEPQNVYQALKNALIAIDLLQRQVLEIQTTCCAPSCDKIKLGFTGTFGEEEPTVTLNFTRGAGTFIPSGFKDAGSTITITDRNGVSVSTVTVENGGAGAEIQMDGTIDDIDITGLATGRLLVSIKTKFVLKDANGNVITTCQDCVGGELNYITDACCAITNSGTEPVVITLKTCSS